VTHAVPFQLLLSTKTIQGSAALKEVRQHLSETGQFGKRVSTLQPSSPPDDFATAGVWLAMSIQIAGIKPSHFLESLFEWINR